MRLPWLMAVSLLFGVGTYFWSKSQPPVYSASATVIASGSNNSSSDPILGGANVRAAPLPDGAVAQAMKSTTILMPLIDDIRSSKGISSDERERLVRSLENDLANQELKTVSLVAKIDQYGGGSGIYTITAKARDSRTAADVANAAAKSLLNWDNNRALEGVKRAEAGFQAQLTQIDEQLKGLPADSIERQTLVGKRVNVLSSLTQTGILANSVTGVLSKLSDAVPPIKADSPKPVRNAVLVSILGLLLLSGLVALRVLTDRTIRSEDDLLNLNVPTLAIIPRLRQRDLVLNGIVRAARQAGLYEAIGFLRVNLLSSLQSKKHPILMVTSTAPGEGKSSLTATLADGLAASGKRVLIIDADLRRGTQDMLWKKFNEVGEWHQLVGQGGARSTGKAFMEPDNVQVLRVENNVDMLPAGESLHDSLSVINNADLDRALTLWRQNYDIVLIDSAPLLALADGLVVGKYVDGVLIVTEFARTNVKSIQSTLRRANRGGLTILGAVINKADARENESYGYSYSHTPKTGVKA